MPKIKRDRNGLGRPLVDIIVVKFNVPKYERETVEFVLRNTQVPYHLRVYDNYPDDKHLSTAWNDAIRFSDADYICLLNSDVQVSRGWLKKMLEVFYTHENVGAVGPITNLCGTHQSGFKGPTNAGLKPCNTLSGFCLLFPKIAWEAVDGFDEQYHLYGEDSDFVERLKRKGYTLWTHYGVHVFHHGHKSMEAVDESGEKDIQAIRKESSKRYREVWRK